MFTWFDFAWPWIGLGFALILSVLLATNVLRSDRTLPRWRDLRWLSFLAVVVYMVHNVEEYGIAANGVVHAFPDSLCAILGQPPYPGCGIPPVFYLFVNLPLVWMSGPLAAILSSRYRLAGLFLWGVIGVNAVVHIVPAIVQREYDPGLLTAIIFFIPLTAMTAVAVIGKYGPYIRRAGAMVLAVGGLLHVVLAGTALIYLRGLLPEWLLFVAQPGVMLVGYLILKAGERRVLKP